MTSTLSLVLSRHRGWRVAALGLLLAAGGGLGAIIKTDVPPPGTANPTVAINDQAGPFRVGTKALDFGTVWANRDFQWSIPITNPTDRDIQVSQIIPSCGCAVADRKEFSIASGDTQIITLSIDLTKNRSGIWRAPGAGRPFGVSVILAYKVDQPGEAKFNVTGQVKDAFYVSSPSVDFGEVSEGDPELPSQRLNLQPVEALAKLWATFDGPLSVAVDSFNSGKNRYPITVSLSEKPPLGEHELTIRLHAITKQGEVLPSFRLPVILTTVGDVRPLPVVNHLGALPVGSRRREVVQLMSRGRFAFRVVAVRAGDAPDAEIKIDFDAPRVRHVVRVSYRILETGDASVPLEIDWTHDDARARQSGIEHSGTLTLPLQYVGVGPGP